MTNSADAEARASQQLSALADGEVDAAEFDEALAAWAGGPEARRAWHEYHLIGDVLRSDELAVTGGSDAAFLAAVRSRLAAEPTVLAPAVSHTVAAPLHQRATGSRRLASFAAVAAGFLVVVAGTLTITGLPFSGGTPEPGLLANGGEPASQVAAAPSPLSTAGGDAVSQVEPTVASGQLIRDARLDSYLAAHHQWSSNAILGGHAGYLRPATADGPLR